LTNTVTILADHKGFARPRVLGDEYVVLGQCAITSFRTGTTASGTITANAVDVANSQRLFQVLSLATTLLWQVHIATIMR
jgi:hypothetical protein